MSVSGPKPEYSRGGVPYIYMLYPYYTSTHTHTHTHIYIYIHTYYVCCTQMTEEFVDSLPEGTKFFHPLRPGLFHLDHFAESMTSPGHQPPTLASISGDFDFLSELCFCEESDSQNGFGVSLVPLQNPETWGTLKQHWFCPLVSEITSGMRKETAHVSREGFQFFKPNPFAQSGTNHLRFWLFGLTDSGGKRADQEVYRVFLGDPVPAFGFGILTCRSVPARITTPFNAC